MAATITKGQTFSATETITNTKLHNLVDLATVSGITNAEISASAAIADTKLAQISTAGTVAGAALTGLTNIPSGAGKIPVANIDTGTTANKIVLLDASAKIPAVDASQVTGLVASQIPDLAASKITSGTMGTARLGSGTASSSTFLRGDSTWAANSPGFTSRARALNTSTGTTVNAGNNGKITFDTEVYDTDNEFSDSKFTATTAGYYYLHTNIYITNGSGTSTYTIYFSLNGAGSMYSNSQCRLASVGSGAAVALSHSDIVYLAAGDYIEVYLSNLSGGATSTVNNGQSSFSIHRIS
jgi:hypothetical protein